MRNHNNATLDELHRMYVDEVVKLQLGKINMADARSPSQLGRVSAQRMLEKHAPVAAPDKFFNTTSWGDFHRGRKFNDEQKAAFEAAYRAEYENLC